MMQMRLMLVDDHVLFMDSLQYLLETYGITVIGQARNGREAVYKVRILNPDIVIMDIRMPECNGLEALKIIKAEKPDIKIVMLTTSDEEEDLFDAIKYGAAGYLLKNTDAKELIRVLEQITSGEVAVSPGMASRLLQEFRQSYSHKGYSLDRKLTPEEYSDLTDRQYEILKLVAEGKTYKEVGAIIGLTERTVKYHMGNIIEHLQMENRAQVIAYASRHKFFED